MGASALIVHLFLCAAARLSVTSSEMRGSGELRRAVESLSDHLALCQTPEVTVQGQSRRVFSVVESSLNKTDVDMYSFGDGRARLGKNLCVAEGAEGTCIVSKWVFQDGLSSLSNCRSRKANMEGNGTRAYGLQKKGATPADSTDSFGELWSDLSRSTVFGHIPLSLPSTFSSIKAVREIISNVLHSIALQTYPVIMILQINIVHKLRRHGRVRFLKRKASTLSEKQLCKRRRYFRLVVSLTQQR